MKNGGNVAGFLKSGASGRHEPRQKVSAAEFAECLLESGSSEAREKEAEESVRAGVEAHLAVGRIGGVWRAGIGTSKTLFVNANVHGLYGAESGIDEEGDRHGIEESGRLLAPLVVEQGEGVGERRALAKEKGALDFVELELRGVEGHDEERDAGGEEFLGGGDVVQDVPFGLRRRWRTETEVAVAAMDGAAHQDDALELAEGGGIFVDGGTDVHQRTDGDERYLAGIAADLVEEKGDGVWVRRLGEMAGFGVAALGESAFRWRRNSGGYEDVRAASFGEETVKKLGAGLRVAKRGGDAEDLELGAAEGEGYGERVVNVIADVGVNDDFFGDGRARG